MTNKAPRLFRLLEEDSFGFAVMTSAEFAGAFFADVSCDRPPNPTAPHTNWYCNGPACPVRDVRILAKYLHEPAPRTPPVMRCPLCGQPMTFHGFLEEATLVPVNSV
jgi:hypothetical protein